MPVGAVEGTATSSGSVPLRSTTNDGTTTGASSVLVFSLVSAPSGNSALSTPANPRCESLGSLLLD